MLISEGEKKKITAKGHVGSWRLIWSVTIIIRMITYKNAVYQQYFSSCRCFCYLFCVATAQKTKTITVDLTCVCKIVFLNKQPQVLLEFCMFLFPCEMNKAVV